MLYYQNALKNAFAEVFGGQEYLVSHAFAGASQRGLCLFGPSADGPLQEGSRLNAHSLMFSLTASTANKGVKFQQLWHYYLFVVRNQQRPQDHFIQTTVLALIARTFRPYDWLISKLLAYSRNTSQFTTGSLSSPFLKPLKKNPKQTKQKKNQL